MAVTVPPVPLAYGVVLELALLADQSGRTVASAVLAVATAVTAMTVRRRIVGGRAPVPSTVLAALVLVGALVLAAVRNIHGPPAPFGVVAGLLLAA